MASRLKLDEELRKLIGNGNVYYQPPETVKMKYPCFVYNRSTGQTLYAENMSYRFTQQYEITYIDKNPDSEMIEKLAKHFPMIRYNRHFTNDNLNHDVFTLYF